MIAANIVVASEALLVVAGIIWMLFTVQSRTKNRIAGAVRPRYGLLQPTGELLTSAALSLGGGWAFSRHPVPNLLTLALLGVVLPAVGGMALAMMIRQEESPMRGGRGWLVLAVTILGGATAGFAPEVF
ncbi:hypothetical protein ACFZDG_26905 [Kitasatospora xanthocidica]|uniref:hypothetical protein n=1 Tax=Kitasatospora xanthocidica TaxID=83382 RepID=UPI0036E689D9